MKQEQPLLVHAKERWQKLLIVLVALMHGALFLYVPLRSPANIYNSPDETANVLLADALKEQSSIRLPVLIKGLPSIVAPRSLHRQDDSLIPVGFPSFPFLIGVVSKVVRVHGIVYLTAILGALALWAWYRFCRLLFGTTIGFYSALLYAFHPALLYWGNRPFFPHALFFALTMFALYFLTRALRLRERKIKEAREVAIEQPTTEQLAVKKRLTSLMAGLCAGLAFALRPPEGAWLIVVIIGVVLYSKARQRLAWLAMLAGAFLPIFGAAVLNTNLYGAPWNTGHFYFTPPGAGLTQSLALTLAPVGFDLGRIGFVAWQYLGLLFWWLSALTLVGIVSMFVRKTITARRMRFWGLGTLLIALYLLQLYGSFTVRDRLDLAPSLGTSFTRYFLPLYVLLIPLAAYGLRALRFLQKGSAFVSAAFIIAAALSLQLTFFSGDESLTQIPQVLAENLAVREQALKVVPEDGIILTERSDKIFFPYREVAASFRRFKPEDFTTLQQSHSMYYETVLNVEDVEKENEEFWKPRGLRAVESVDLGGRHVIYRLVKQD